MDTNLETDRLMGADKDSHAEVVAADNLREPGVLGVGEPHTA